MGTGRISSEGSGIRNSWGLEADFPGAMLLKENRTLAQTDRVLQQFESQAKASDELGSPFTARLCRILATRLDTRTRFGKRILEWDGDPFADNVALRACGALHALARSGWEPNVTAVYPPAVANDHSLWVAIADALGHNDAFLTDRLSSAPQTNEVARSRPFSAACCTSRTSPVSPSRYWRSEPARASTSASTPTATSWGRA